MEQETIPLKNYAYIGDAVWELFVRKDLVFKNFKPQKLHNITTERVNAAFQKNMLEFILPDLTQEEAELEKRARNLPIPVARRHIQKNYRAATALETLIGYWYLHDKARLSSFLDKFRKKIEAN